MFRGLATCSMDVKGRVTVPSNYRKILTEETDGKLVLTIDTEERCLLLYTLPHWLRIEEELGKLPSFHSATRRIRRLLIGHATDLELDRQGRILLPTVLRDYANLVDKAMMVGLGNKIAVYAESEWQLRRESWLSEGIDGEVGVPPELEAIVW